MRLATVLDSESNEARAVFELPNGQRIELSELFRPEASGDRQSRLHEMPIYFTKLSKTVEFLDDVTDAVRQWSRERADRVATVLPSSRSDQMSFLPPIPVVRNLREFDAFESSARNWRTAVGLPWSENWAKAPAYSFGCASSLIGHDAKLIAPTDCQQLDFGLQLGVFIGVGGRNISAANAWQHVAGFTIANAFVSRECERRVVPLGLGRGTARDFATAVGPYLVSMNSLRDRIDVDDRVHLSLRALRNGSEIVRVDAATMHFTWPQLIEQASRDTELFPGELLLSGAAPGGSLLDQKSTDWLHADDVIELEAERLGTLRTRIAAQ